MSQLKFLLCNLRIKGCGRKDSPLPAPWAAGAGQNDHTDLFLLCIHDTKARAFWWTISLFGACPCWLAESPLAEPVNSVGCHHLWKPTRIVLISCWLKEKIPGGQKATKSTGCFLSAWQTPRDLGLCLTVNGSQLQPTRCACPEMFGAQVIFPSFVLWK